MTPVAATLPAGVTWLAACGRAALPTESPDVIPPAPVALDGTTLTALADHMGVTAGTMSVAVDRLVKRGYITRSADSADRRRILLRLTAAGAAVFDLSPLRTDALGPAYAGKAPGALLVHKAFKVAKAMAPPIASTSLTKWPLPMPPMLGLQLICPKVSMLCVSSKVSHPMRAAASAMSATWMPSQATPSSCLMRMRPTVRPM